MSQQAHAMGFLPMMVTLVSLFFGLGCSAGALMVQVPTPTPTPHKTVQPTFTITPFPTATFTPTPTPPPTFTPTPTATPMPTATPLPQDTAAPPPPPAQAAAPAPAPAEPQAPPTPSEPTPTPTPAFPFNVVYATHNTGSPGETRFTAWVRVDHRPGEFKTLANFQMKVLAPDGNTYLSEPSGSGFADSTMAGTGDNHWMNTKLEIRPYSPGVYKIYLVEGEVQVSPETEITLSTDPLQYIHFDFFKSEPK